MVSILVVEDHTDSRLVVELILRDANYQVYSAQNGAAGVQMALQVLPDVILMDMAMPEMNGWQATRLLKTNPSTRNIPIIAFTAQAGSQAVKQAFDAGCDSILAKPFEIDELLLLIESLAQRERFATPKR